METLKLTRHLILKDGKRPVKIPLDKPLIKEIAQIQRYALKTITKIHSLYDNMDLAKEEHNKCFLSLQVNRSDGTYTFNIKENITTVMYVYFNKCSEEEILLEWVLNEKRTLCRKK